MNRFTITSDVMLSNHPSTQINFLNIFSKSYSLHQDLTIMTSQHSKGNMTKAGLNIFGRMKLTWHFLFFNFAVIFLFSLVKILLKDLFKAQQHNAQAQQSVWCTHSLQKGVQCYVAMIIRIHWEHFVSCFHRLPYIPIFCLALKIFIS